MLDRVQEREQCAPRIADQRQAFEVPQRAERLQIGDLLRPSDRHLAGHGRPAAAALIVVDQRSPRCESVEPREEVVVVRAGAAVQHDGRRSAADSPLEELHAPDVASEGLGHAGR